MLTPEIASGAAAISGLVVLSVISKMSSSTGMADKGGTAKAGTALVAQAMEWHTLSDSDDAVYAFRHSVLALAYMNAARFLCTDAVLQKGTGIDVHDTVRVFEAKQRKTMALVAPVQLVKKAPKKAPPGAASWL